MAARTFEFVLPPELREKLEAYAKENDMPVSQVVRRAIKEFLSKESEK